MVAFKSWKTLLGREDEIQQQAEETITQEITEHAEHYQKKKQQQEIRKNMVPVPFSTEGKNMLIHTKELLEFEEPILAINAKFEKLTTSLRNGHK